MKTKDLIQQLSEADPTGELEVVTDWGDVYKVETLPAYYDGRLITLILDEHLESAGYYSVKGLKISSSGLKVVLSTLTLRNVIWSFEKMGKDLIIEYDSEQTKQAMEDTINDIKEAWKEYQEAKSK